MYTIDCTPEWNFSIIADGHQYDIVWMKRVRVEDGYTSYRIVVNKDEEEADEYENAVRLAVKAASAYRTGQIHSELKQRPEYYKPDVVKDFIVELYERSVNGEYLGQLVDELLYIDTVVQILEVADQRVYEMISELIEEERLGINGAILTSYEKLAETRSYWEGQVGHKQFDRSDLPDGMWGCTYCGSTGWLDDVAPTELECIKDAYKNEEGMSTFFTHQEENPTSSE